MERNEPQAPDAFVANAGLDPVGLGGGVDVGHEDGRGVAFAGLPGRVALERLAVGGGKAGPGLEPHHAVRVEEKDGRPVAPERLDDGVESGRERLVK